MLLKFIIHFFSKELEIGSLGWSLHSCQSIFKSVKTFLQPVFRVGKNMQYPTVELYGWNLLQGIKKLYHAVTTEKVNYFLLGLL